LLSLDPSFWGFEHTDICVFWWNKLFFHGMSMD
jgi:hypothetical protein